MSSVETTLNDRAVSGKERFGKAFWVQVGLLVLLVGFVYGLVLSGLAKDWWADPDYSHGFLVPLFSAFVIWQKRKKLAQLPMNPSWWGLIVALGSLGILLVGVFGAEFFLQRTSFLFLLAGLTIYFLGWHWFYELLFPWAFLFFMIPFPSIVFNQIAFPLQFFAAHLASSMLTLLGIPVLREGNIIQLPTMSLEVAEACSGIRSLMSLGALAVIYGYLLDNNNWRRLILALAAIPIAVVANGFRIMGSGFLGYYWEPDKAEGFFHLFSGWVIFVISIVLLFAVHAFLRWVWNLASRGKEAKP